MRSSIHLTGRPPALRDSRAVMSVPRAPPLPPKLPPWGWLIRRTLFGGKPKHRRDGERHVELRLEAAAAGERPVVGSHWLITPKVSSGFAPSRFQRNFSVTT